jgi:DNA-binding transcriptional regulator LsrR (DeoR family)
MKSSERALLVRLAAYLRGREKLKEKEIAVRLGGIAISTVSSLLLQAREAGLLEEQLVYKDGELTQEEEHRLYVLQFQSALRTSLEQKITSSGRHDRAPRIYLYDLAADGTPGASIDASVRRFATQAAPEYRRLLTRPSVKVVGVAWGGTLACLTDAMRIGGGAPPRARDPVTVIATCGEPLDNRPTNESSSAIAEAMSLALNGSRDHARTLGIAPAYLPAGADGNGSDFIWRHIVATKPYLEVFGPGRIPAAARPPDSGVKQPLSAMMDAYFTCIAAEGSTLGYGKHKIYRAHFVDAEIENVVFGDMGGIPLPRPNLTESQRKVLKSIEDSWTGLQREQLIRCVSRGFEGHPNSRPPGCILTAIGAHRARTVYQAVVVEGLVNHLFIDSDCGKALETLLADASAS